MTTTSLPDRLRALADHIAEHNLPEPSNLSISNGLYRAGTAHFDTHDEVCRWAEVAGREIEVREVPSGTGHGPFTSYTLDAGLPGWQWFTVTYHRMHVPAVSA